MQLKRETEVAIAILVACARTGDCLLKTAVAAKAAETSTDFAAHIALRLVNARLLEAKRGRTGGLKLARSADCIFLGDVISILEKVGVGKAKVREESAAYHIPGLKQIMAGANDTMRDYLDRFSVADLATLELPDHTNRASSGSRR
jgi:Rrf2 family protein